MRTYQYNITFLIIISLMSASCASYKAVHPEPVNIQSVIEPGDTIKVLAKDNKEFEFVVVEVTDEAVVGENVEVPLTDITELKEETVSAEKKFLGIMLLLVVGAAVMYQDLNTGSTSSALGDVADGVKGRSSYSRYHPGDWYAIEHGIDEKLCVKECAVTFKCYRGVYSMGRNNRSDSSMVAKMRKSCSARLKACKFECIQTEQHPIGYIAGHVQGGYYSDGSYYRRADLSGFKNIHPTKDKYEKTKWQKDRDECMELTSENVKPTFWNRRRSRHHPEGFFNLSKKYYQDCLKERGY